MSDSDFATELEALDYIAAKVVEILDVLESQQATHGVRMWPEGIWYLLVSGKVCSGARREMLAQAEMMNRTAPSGCRYDACELPE